MLFDVVHDRIRSLIRSCRLALILDKVRNVVTLSTRKPWGILSVLMSGTTSFAICTISWRQTLVSISTVHVGFGNTFACSGVHMEAVNYFRQIEIYTTMAETAKLASKFGCSCSTVDFTSSI